jgi:hypothetical protein
MPPRSDALPAPRNGLFARARASALSAVGWVRQLLSPLDADAIATSGGIGARPDYSALQSMSAMAAFPWVRVCIQAKMDDIAGVPLVAVRGEAETEPVRSHPFLDLMRRPAPGVTETVFRRQLVLDLGLAKNVFLWLREVPGGWELRRLHPEHCAPEIGRNGEQVGWIYRRSKRLPLTSVWHIRDASWQDDDAALFGEPITRPAHEGLLAVRSARRHAALQAEQGRPDFILTLPDTAAIGPGGVERIRDRYADSMTSCSSPAAAAS